MDGHEEQLIVRRLDIRANLSFALKWLAIAGVLSLAIGTLCAGFRWLLDWATRTRESHPVMLYALPVAGLLVGSLRRRYGLPDSQSGSLVDELHAAKAQSSGRRTVLGLAGTLITHLFGGSAGWEVPLIKAGTTMGRLYARRLVLLNAEDHRRALMAGVAGSFAAIFGTPIAGMLFGAEVMGVDWLRYESLLPCLIAGLFSDGVCKAWGTRQLDFHQTVAIGHFEASTLAAMLKAILAGICFGALGGMFTWTLKVSRAIFAKARSSAARLTLGACALIAFAWLFDTRVFLGLGISSSASGGPILSALQGGATPIWSWIGKTLFTAITLGSGFDGGEVTPLLYIGSTFGNILAGVLREPAGLMASLGFVGILAGATNAPLACTVMGFELFGADHIIIYALACFSADYVRRSKIFPPYSLTAEILLGAVESAP